MSVLQEQRPSLALPAAHGFAAILIPVLNKNRTMGLRLTLREWPASGIWDRYMRKGIQGCRRTESTCRRGLASAASWQRENAQRSGQFNKSNNLFFFKKAFTWEGSDKEPSAISFPSPFSGGSRGNPAVILPVLMWTELNPQENRRANVGAHKCKPQFKNVSLVAWRGKKKHSWQVENALSP